MRKVVIALVGPVFALGLLSCRVNETMCVDLIAHEVEARTGCLARGSRLLPGSRCIQCPEDGCGIDLNCARSSCVASPDGRVFVIPCIDATMREWPEGWRPIRRRQIPDDPALTDTQRATCLSASVHERFCRTRGTLR